ncbi:centrosomal protein of 126 kDa [Brachyistius frenatus]|uniref:centrosomal protein of 126 kDa n=1 Tax=Brachyistius frenatus TaxID=100188 RepID=UPI0037E96DF2
MQVLQDSFFYHSDLRLGADGGLEKERQLLVEEQKLCKTRALKFSSETNRRRKALDERRKRWDMQEQRLRENILQQRRLQVQDATERFQRAHIPPSQRRRQSFRRNVTNIQDALNQIQGTYTRQSSLLSSNSNVSRNCTPSPRPPTLSKSSHLQALSAVEAYTKLLQEQSRAEKQQDHSPQGSHQSDWYNSESLSSKDSLENEEPNHSTKNRHCSYSSFLLDSEKAYPDLRKQNNYCPSSDLTSFSAMMLLGDNLAQSRKPNEPKQKKQEDPGWPVNRIYVSKASWGFTSIEQTPQTETQPAPHNCDSLTLCDIFNGEAEHFEINSSQNRPSDNIVTTRAALGNTALEFSYPKEEALLDLEQPRIHDDRQLTYTSATQTHSPAKNENSKDILFETPPKPNIFLNNSTTDNLSKGGTLQQTGKQNRYLSSQKEPSASINNLNKVSNSELTTEKSININTASLQHACSSNIQSDVQKCREGPEKEVQKLPVSMATSHSVCEVRFIKGILKKQSRYISGDAACVYGSGHLIFAKQVALAIRDSVELTRAKTKDVEGNNTVKKKLRWFDEVHLEKEAKEQSILKQMKGKPSNFFQSKINSEDHQLSLTAVSRTPKAGPSMTPVASTGYHFTKEAWADVGVQVSLPQERADEVKVPRSSTRTGGPKVPRRERSARVGAGPVSSRARKGIVIRPQSATEVSQIAKTQGKIMVPRPPPRTEPAEEKTACITRTPYGRNPPSVNSKPALAAEQTLHKTNSDGFFSPNTHHVITTDSTVMYTPLPPSYTCPFPEGNPSSSGHQETHNHCRRKGMVYNEKGLCLDCTPTDEEISQLWHGVRSALTTKEAKTILRRQALESGQVLRKPCAEQSRQPPGSGNKRLLQTTGLVRPFSSSNAAALQNEGFQSASQLHLGEVHAEGLLEERDIVAAMETAQTQRPGTVQQHRQQQGLTTISLEEKKILQSLDRLNHQLHCVQEHIGSSAGTHGLVLIDAPYTKEGKVTNHYKHRASSATNRSRYQKKF